MGFFAHSGNAADKSDWQRLDDHLLEVARRAAEYARPFGLEAPGYALGLLHDLGKYDPAFQPRLEGANVRVDHSTAGAKVLVDMVAEATRTGAAKPYDAAMAEMLAYCVLGHHAGLPDRNTADASCFQRRIDGFVDRLDPIWRSEIAFDASGLAPEQMLKKIAGRQQHGFDLSVMTRMLFSCLVDADYKDTELHYRRLEGREPDRQWPLLQDLLPDFQARYEAHMAGFDGGGEVNRLRAGVLAHVRGKAALAPGLFTLTVPTGGGKTLASLGFALDHARLHGHRRIIFSIPFSRAWVETPIYDFKALRPNVARFARAWVETATTRASTRRSTCRPLRAGVGRNIGGIEAPKGYGSRPLRAGVGRNRGGGRRVVRTVSPASRGRGSKPSRARKYTCWSKVARFARAWVETTASRCRNPTRSVARFARAWVETVSERTIADRSESPASRGRGSKQKPAEAPAIEPASPASRGRGSKPHEGAGIASGGASPASRGRGSKQHRRPAPVRRQPVARFARA